MNVKDLVLSQRNAANDGFDERVVVPVASGLFGFDGSSIPTGITVGAGLTIAAGVLKTSGAGAFDSLVLASDTLPLLLGSGNASTINDGGVVLSRAVGGVSSTNAHGFSDASTISRSAGMAYGSIDSNPVFTGAGGYLHYVGLQSRGTYSGAGTLADYYGADVTLRMTLGTITRGHGFCSEPISQTGGTLTTYYGFRAKAAGGTIGTTWAFYADTDPSFFGGGIAGTTTNSSAGAGIIGQQVISTVAQASAVSLTTATSANVASISLTAGDWDVFGTVIYLPGATTSVTQLTQGGSVTSATLTGIAAGDGSRTIMQFAAFVPGANTISQTFGPNRVSLSATTTYYMVANAAFTLSTMAAYGTLRARRMR